MQSKPFVVLSTPRGGTGGTWSVDLTGQNAAITEADLVPALQVIGGLYVVKGVARVTTAAGTSSSVNVKIKYTDNEGPTVVNPTVEGFVESVAGIVITPVNSTTASGIFYFSKVINAANGVAIRYSTVYASNPGSAMVYTLRLICSRF